MVAIAGCGDGTQKADEPLKAPGPSPTVETAPQKPDQTPVTPETGSEAPNGTDSERDRIAVTVTLANGKIAASTPSVVTVPADFAVELEVQVEDDRDYKLKVVRSEGASPENLSFTGNGTYAHPIGTLASGQESTVTAGGRTIMIIAGAEPGP